MILTLLWKEEITMNRENYETLRDQINDDIQTNIS